ncbi:glyoxalase-like domain protein [Brenneria roseae subsp. americana]|uniref:Glyoxalase-like domain protein n=1 Tax=Brenneria roseae subsp. americana TaxID=1508507 RepID=A0A2U1TIQ1_9GAMM|nr:glyoxalase-like domain protein [Brenneria roseae]PWC09239.1 glyoxalase-like domain protein [Brenneria roseae subsp. americana]
MEIDHIFICSEHNAPIADVLVENGILEGTHNIHPGQGTANRRFFFNNVFLEFIYLEEPSYQHKRTSPELDIIQRLTDQKKFYSPFGVGCRPTRQGESVPFPHWQYQPSYLPAGYSIDVGIAIPNEPLWFFLDFSGRPDQVEDEKRQPLNHPCGIRELTGIQLSIPKGNPLSLSADAVKKIDGVEINQGEIHNLTLTFDSGEQNKKITFSPEMPLTIFY